MIHVGGFLSRFNTIRGRLFLLLAIVLVPALLVQYLIYKDRFEIRFSEELEANLEIARATGMAFQQFSEDVLHQELIIGLVLTASVRLAQEDIDTILEKSADEHPAVLSFAWIDSRGRIIHSSFKKDIGIDLSAQPFFQEMRGGADVHVSDLSLMRGSGRPFFTISRSFRDGTGNLLGVVTAIIEPDLLHTILAFERGGGGAVSLLDRTGRVAMRHPGIDLEWERRDRRDDLPDLIEALKGREVFGEVSVGLDRRARVYAFSPINSTGWVVAASRPEAEVVDVIKAMLLRDSVMFLAVVLLSLPVAAIVASTISSPVRRLRERASRISEENGFSVGIGGPSEIKDLTFALQRMTHELNRARDDAETRAAELNEQKELLRNVLDVLPVGVFITDEAGRITRANPAVEKIWGGARDVPLSHFDQYKGWWKATGKRIEAHEWALARAFINGETSINEVIDIECFDGSRKTILNSAAPVRNERGEIISAVAVIMDISERIEAEVGMQQAKENAERLADELEQRVRERTLELEQANRAKDEFLANMSHEVRTPMSGVFGMTDVLLQRELPESVRIDLEIIRDSAGTVLSLLNDLLDLSRIEQGKLELSPQVFDLREMVGPLSRPFEVQAKGKGLDFELVVNDDVPEWVVCDPDRLGQVLKNLLSNAVKFTEQGAIRVNIGLDRESPSSLGFSISDTGIGIPEEKQGRLFQSFTQLDPSYSKKFAGVGLGLAISKRLVELMGGEITVRSAPGKGSVFSFTVRFEQADSETSWVPRQELALEDLPPLSIMLAEDNVVNRMFLRRALTQAGHQVVEVEDGRQAMEKAGEQRFDLILMDIQMPEMDGLESMRRIREGEAGEENRAIPVIALTAYAMKGDRERFLAEGMNGYVSKPVDFGELALAMREVIGSANKHPR
jgi:PAS domain S-box-containing protein